MALQWTAKINDAEVPLVKLKLSRADSALLAEFPDGEVVKAPIVCDPWGFRKSVGLRERTKGMKASFYGLER